MKKPNGDCAHYVMVSKFQWKPFRLATRRDPQNDWTATQNRVNYNVFAQAPSATCWAPSIVWIFGQNNQHSKWVKAAHTSITELQRFENVYWLTRANCHRAEKYGGIRWKGQCPFALVQHTEKFWNIFFQTFRAGMLFFSGGYKGHVAPIMHL